MTNFNMEQAIQFASEAVKVESKVRRMVLEQAERKRYQVLMYAATAKDVNVLGNGDGETFTVYSTLNYDRNSFDQENSGLRRQSQSYLTDLFKKSLIEFTMTIGEKVMTRYLYDMTRFAHIDFAGAEEDVIEMIFEDGIVLGEHKYVFFMATASELRSSQAIFVRADQDIHRMYKVMGNDPIAYAKIKNDVIIIDITKALKRFGLAGTNTVPVDAIQIGNEIVEHVNGDYSIVGGTHTMRVIAQPHYVVREGKYWAFNKETKQPELLNAAQFPRKMPVGDGVTFLGPRIMEILKGDGQLRITPSTKGMGIGVSNLHDYYEEDIVVMEGAAKQDYRKLFMTNPDYKIQFRVAIFNKDVSENKEKTGFTYQFMHTTSLTAEQVWPFFKEVLEEAVEAAKTPEGIKAYTGMAHNEEALTTTFTKFLYHTPWAFHDVRMRTWAVELIDKMLEDWKTAAMIPVTGEYRYMIQDPYACLEALKANVRDEDGDVIVQPEHVFIKPGHVFINDKHNMNTDYVSLHRNPAVVQGEGVVAKGSVPGRYMAAALKGSFLNLCIMSVADMLTVSMGGADNDGDTALVCREPVIVNHLREMMSREEYLPILDVHFYEKNGEIIFKDGCPWSAEATGMYKCNADLMEQDVWTVKVPAKKYKTHAKKVFHEMHELQKSFVIKFMKNQNRIGEITNYATALADGIRSFGTMLREGVNMEGAPLSDADKARIRANLTKWKGWVRLLRFVQGWEIDAAKHGGEYNKHLADELAFFKFPPEELSVVVTDNGKERRKWIRPLWLAEYKGENLFDPRVQKTNSVMSRLRNMATQYVNSMLMNIRFFRKSLQRFLWHMIAIWH
jgi:hypothetical protein